MATYLVTGANRGIGLEYCRQLKAKGETVIAVCRSSSPELDKLCVNIQSGIDITSENSLSYLRDKFSNIKINVLIHNAGVAQNNSFQNLDAESIRTQFEVNALAPLLLTKVLIGSLIQGSKVILMTSRMGSIGDNTSGGLYGYRMSKVAMCMAGKSLSIDLYPLGIPVAMLHPGLVSTRMTGFTPNGITTQKSVEGLLQRIDSLTLQSTGSFWHSNGEILPW